MTSLTERRRNFTAQLDDWIATNETNPLPLAQCFRLMKEEFESNLNTEPKDIMLKYMRLVNPYDVPINDNGYPEYGNTRINNLI
jgi:hypothetical protein